MIDYGTEPHKLARTADPGTSKIAAHAVNTSRWESRVYEIIKSFGRQGCIQDEVLRMCLRLYGHIPYSTVTARFKSLQEKDLIYYNSERRKGKSGRPSRVRVASIYMRPPKQGTLL